MRAPPAAPLRREPDAERFLRFIARSDGCSISAFTLLETGILLAGRRGHESAWAAFDDLIVRAGIEIIAEYTALARAARAAFLRYGKGHHPAGLNLGDCVSCALASARKLPLLFKGKDFRKTDLAAAD